MTKHTPPPAMEVVHAAPSRAYLADLLDALATIANAPGLEEVLAAHRITSGYDWDEESYSFCSCGLEAAVTDHLADVVRAWLRGEGT